MITKDNIFDMVAPWINYIAVDGDGEMWGFKEVPYRQKHTWDIEGTQLVAFGNYLYILPWWTDWKESLISRQRHGDESKWIGKWCFMWDDASQKYESQIRVLRMLKEIDFRGKYLCFHNNIWTNCRPATKEEILLQCFEPSE